MAMRGVLRVGEVCIRVLDMAESRKHYVERMGLHPVMTDADGKLYLKSWDEHDHHCLVLREADSSGMDYVAFKVYSDADLDVFESRLKAFGISDIRHAAAGVYPGTGRRLVFTMPTGHEMHLYATMDQIGNSMSTHNPGVLPDEGVIRGFRINRLDHVLLGGVNIEESQRMFLEVFDFDLSERLFEEGTGRTLATFMACSTKPHDIAFVSQPRQGLFHHVSFLLESVTDVIHAADLIGKHRIPVDVGPNRHGVTRGATIYFFDPSGNRNEVFSGGYVHYPDTPTLTWDTSNLGEAIFSQDCTPRESFLTVLT